MDLDKLNYKKQTSMKANQIYRQWITNYRIEKNDKSGEPIQDGDLLDWLAEKFERGDFMTKSDGCQCNERTGETTVWCCNQCGLPCEEGWLKALNPYKMSAYEKRS